jgi:nucleotide-binding universal stress UspA family protein
MIPRRILVPVTLARESAEVAAEAATLAAAVHAELLLLGVAPVAEASEQGALDQLVAQRLHELTAGLPPAAGARVLLTRGAVARELVAAARRRDADLVVVPFRRGREPDAYVLRHTEVPLLLVPSSAVRRRGCDRTSPPAGC